MGELDPVLTFFPFFFFRLSCLFCLLSIFLSFSSSLYLLVFFQCPFASLLNFFVLGSCRI